MSNVKKSLLIKVEWLRVKVHVYFVEDVVKFRNVTLRKKYPKIPEMEKGGAYALCTHSHEYPSDHFLILNHEASWGTIAHECFHCAKGMLEGYDIEDEEAIAHMITYLVDEIQIELEK